MFRIAEFSIDFVFNNVTHNKLRKPIQVEDKTYYVKMNSQRYFCFKKQLFCNSCKLQGIKFYLETSCLDKYSHSHFNLYAEENGQEILMTKDHIIPRSKKGNNNLSNYVTMCTTCNFLKDSSFITYDQVFELRKYWNENVNKLNKRELIKNIESIRLDYEKWNLNQLVE